jgi:NAD(P)-dependent dehydrogenase (short-subunit alcohol dehydrogenase family)
MKNILITGASRGIGRAAAVLAGAEGWSVAVNYLADKQAAEDTAGFIRQAGGRAVTSQGDVAQEADIIAMFDAAEKEFGPLDGVVVNAGIVGPASKLADMPTDRMTRIFDVNILGAFLCAREAARRLPKSKNGKGGSIVVMSSIAAASVRRENMSITPPRKRRQTL